MSSSSSFHQCPSGYRCAAQVDIRKGKDVQPGSEFVFEEGCPAPGYVNARKRCVPLNDPSPIESSEVFRPCQMFSDVGFDERACTTGGKTGCLCVLKHSAIEKVDVIGGGGDAGSGGTTSSTSKRFSIYPGVYADGITQLGMPLGPNVLYRLMPGESSRGSGNGAVLGGSVAPDSSGSPFVNSQSPDANTVLAAGTSGGGGTGSSSSSSGGGGANGGGSGGADSAGDDATAGTSVAPSISVIKRYAGGMSTGLPMVTDTTWKQLLVNQLHPAGDRFLEPMSAHDWLTKLSYSGAVDGSGPSASGGGAGSSTYDSPVDLRLSHVAKAMRVAKKVLHNLVEAAEKMGLQVASPVSEPESSQKFCDALKRDDDGLWNIATGLKYLQRAQTACLRTQEEALKMIVGPSDHSSPGKDDGSEGGVMPFVTKDQKNRIPKCLRNEQHTLPWRHVVARIASEAQSCMAAEVPNGSGTKGMALSILQNFYIE